VGYVATAVPLAMSTTDAELAFMFADTSVPASPCALLFVGKAAGKSAITQSPDRPARHACIIGALAACSTPASSFA
jgi:hypothetical protein